MEDKPFYGKDWTFFQHISFECLWQALCVVLYCHFDLYICLLSAAPSKLNEHFCVLGFVGSGHYFATIHVHDIWTKFAKQQLILPDTVSDHLWIVSSPDSPVNSSFITLAKGGYVFGNLTIFFVW